MKLKVSKGGGDNKGPAQIKREQLSTQIHKLAEDCADQWFVHHNVKSKWTREEIHKAISAAYIVGAFIALDLSGISSTLVIHHTRE